MVETDARSALPELSCNAAHGACMGRLHATAAPQMGQGVSSQVTAAAARRHATRFAHGAHTTRHARMMPLPS